MKKILLLMFCMIFLLGNLSALLETGNYIESNSNDSIGNYTINNLLGLPEWLGGGKLAEYTLDKNYYSVFDGYAEGRAKLFSDGQLFSDLGFYKEDKKTTIPLASSEVMIGRNITASQEVPTYENVCSHDLNSTNETCVHVQNGTTIQYSNEIEWSVYNGEILEGSDEGEIYYWKIHAKRSAIDTGAVDWIASSFSVEMDKWATWWNVDWAKKKPINITNNVGSNLINYTTLAFVTYDSDMNSTFQDLRFVNSAENTEIGYWIQNSTASTSAYVWLNTSLTASINTTFYMYYGNPAVSTTSSRSNVWKSSLNESIGTNPTSSSGLNANMRRGVSISALGKDLLLLEIMKKSGTSPTVLEVWLGATGTGGTNPSTASFSGDVATFNPFRLSNGVENHLLNNNPSGSWTEIYTNSGVPSAKSNINYTRQVYKDGSGALSTASGFSTVIAVTTDARASTEPTVYFGAEEAQSQITISLYYPLDNANLTESTVTLMGNLSVEGVTVIQNVSSVINGTINQTNTSGIAGNYQFPTTFPEGFWNWTIIAYDTLNNLFETVTREFTIDTVSPTIVSGGSPNGTYNYLYPNYNLTLNFTATDPHLSTCIWNYNSSNTTVPCTSGILATHYFNYSKDENSGVVFVNDTVGNWNSSSYSWGYEVFDFLNYTYDENATELSSTTFIGEFKIASSLTTSYFQYNNTNYSTSINSLGDNTYIISKTIVTPAVSVNTNISWNFWVNNINATSYNQTVLNVALDNCSSFTNYLINYYFVDELTQDDINDTNSTLESLVNLKTLTGQDVSQFNQTFSGTSNASICSEIDLTSSGLRFWEQSRYGSTDYVFEEHNLQNTSMSSLPNNITLRDLPSSSATTFRISYRSSTFLPVENAVVQVQRKYIGEGVYKETESPLTDTSGETSASFDLDSVLYRIIVSLNGTTLSTFENPAIACDNILTGDCTININERQSVDLINNYDLVNDFNYGLTQDNRTITLTFEIPSGASKLVNLFVNQSTILGNSTSCNQSVTATSGQLQCDIDNTLGDVFAIAQVNVENNQITTASTTILDDRSQYFGTDNIVLTFFLVLSLTLLMVSDAIAVLIGLVIGIIASSLMLFLNSGSLFGTTSVLMYLVIVVIILVVKISMRNR